MREREIGPYSLAAWEVSLSSSTCRGGAHSVVKLRFEGLRPAREWMWYLSWLGRGLSCVLITLMLKKKKKKKKKKIEEEEEEADDRY